ncbi:MAG TPA: hypothetical protein VGL54_08780 [Solirubrobacteraceae bacterium]
MSITTSSAYASSGFGIERYDLAATQENSSMDTQAGSHPYELTAEAVFEPNAHNTSADEVKNLDFTLPPGLMIDLAAVPQNNAVGMAQMSIAGKIVSATVYNLAPAPGELARLGFTLEGAWVVADISIRPGSDYGMTLSVQDLPELGIESVKLTLGGSGSSTFLTLPTSCDGSLQTTVQGVSREEEMTSLAASFPQLIGCNRLSFQPALSVVPDVTEADEPSGYQIGLRIPQTEDSAGLASSDLKNATVTLPEGASISLAAADGLQTCTQAQIGLGSSAAAVCPEASKVGVVTANTPFLANPLEGAIYLATPNENPFDSPLAVYIVAEDPVAGVQVKLAGQLEPNPVTGQFTIALRELPQLPISDLELNFFGGERALLSTPPTCGLATSTGELTPWSGDSDATAFSAFAIEQGADAMPCSSSGLFGPTFQVGSTGTGEAGVYDSLTLLLTRADQEEQFGAIAIQAPAAFAQMFAGMQPCEEPQASQGMCPAASALGTVAAQAGLGYDSVELNGEVYLTGPYGGAAQGLEIVLPVDPAPLRLGDAVVRMSAQIESGTNQLHIAGPLPSIAGGVPLQIKALQVQLDREFRISPEGCESLTVTGTITGARGGSATTAIEPWGVPVSPCPSQTASAPAATMSSTSTAGLSLAGTRLITTGRGQVAIELKCTGTSACDGKLTLTTKTEVKGKRRRSRTISIGTTRFSIPPDKTATIELKLNSIGRALLGADHGRLSTSLRIVKSSPAPSHTYTDHVQLVLRKADGKAKK